MSKERCVDGKSKDVVCNALKSGGTLLDVRTPLEFHTIAIHGSINIPYDQIAENIELIKSFSRPVVIYCAVAIRAELAINTLLELGFSDVVNGETIEKVARSTAALDLFSSRKG